MIRRLLQLLFYPCIYQKTRGRKFLAQKSAGQVKIQEGKDLVCLLIAFLTSGEFC